MIFRLVIATILVLASFCANASICNRKPSWYYFYCDESTCNEFFEVGTLGYHDCIPLIETSELKKIDPSISLIPSDPQLTTKPDGVLPEGGARLKGAIRLREYVQAEALKVSNGNLKGIYLLGDELESPEGFDTWDDKEKCPLLGRFMLKHSRKNLEKTLKHYPSCTASFKKVRDVQDFKEFEEFKLKTDNFWSDNIPDVVNTALLMRTFHNWLYRGIVLFWFFLILMKVFRLTPKNISILNSNRNFWGLVFGGFFNILLSASFHVHVNYLAIAREGLIGRFVTFANLFLVTTILPILGVILYYLVRGIIYLFKAKKN